MADDKSSQTPTYVAQCPQCGALIACAVAPLDEPATLRHALKEYESWQRDGYKTSVRTVADVRTWPKGEMFKHRAECLSAKRRVRR